MRRLAASPGRPRVVLLLIILLVYFPLAALASCHSRPLDSRKQCAALQHGCPNLMFVGPGCPRANDGGCQPRNAEGGYCGFHCRSKCVRSRWCQWKNSSCVDRCTNAMVIGNRGVPNSTVDLLVQAQSWSSSAIGDWAVVPANFAFCNLVLYISAPSYPASTEFSTLRISFFRSNDTDFSKPYVSLAMSQRSYVALSSLSPTPLYAVTYIANSPVALPSTSGPTVLRVVFGFPQWRKSQMSLISTLASSSSPTTPVPGCSFEWSSAMRVPLDLCLALQTPYAGQLLYEFLQ